MTLITRPRRFGKTLLMNTVERFFSTEYEGRGAVFEGLDIWKEEPYRQLQGKLPVIGLSFADIKEGCFHEARKKICQILTDLYNRYGFLLNTDCMEEREKEFFRKVSPDMPDYMATLSLKNLSLYLSRYYDKKVIILLDEYDTPMQEAYVGGYWDEMAEFIRSLFHSTFKTNPYLERAIMTGITRISTPKASLGKESLFSDLNNLTVITSTSDAYAEYFGFTQQEVSNALAEYGLSEKESDVKAWYDGFSFGQYKDIYNPWSILNYLKNKKFAAYWANTSSNSLIGKLIREGSKNIKIIMEDLLRGKSFRVHLDEQIIFEQLGDSEEAVWSLLLAGGYLKVVHHEAGVTDYGEWVEDYELALTNFEVKVMFQGMIRGWFGVSQADYNDFIKALLAGDTEEMNAYMSRVCEDIFSSFDTGKGQSARTEPERFYHGFVLGLMMDLNQQYVITSNRESGFTFAGGDLAQCIKAD